MFVVAVTADLRLALSLGGGYSVLAFTFSGLSFPIMAMYGGVRIFSRIFPFTYFTDMIVDQALRGAPVSYSLPDMSYMLLFLLLPAVVLPRLYRISTDSRYWGKM